MAWLALYVFDVTQR